jgi:hypothetical protein
LWDGGLVANNPALAAVTEVARLRDPQPYDVRVISVGTGHIRTRIPLHDSGLLPFSKWISNAFIGTSVVATAYTVSQLLRNKALRLNVRLNEQYDYELDDAGAVKDLEKRAKKWARRYIGTNHGVAQPGRPRIVVGDWLAKHWS